MESGPPETATTMPAFTAGAPQPVKGSQHLFFEMMHHALLGAGPHWVLILRETQGGVPKG